MNRIDRKKVLHLVTRYVMLKRGHELPDGYNYEWDLTVPDSQIAMVYEDVEFVLEALEKYKYEVVAKP